MSLREHLYRTPAPTLRDGVPLPPRWMLLGSELLAVDLARVISVDHEGQGRIVVRLAATTGRYERLGDPDRKPGALALPQHLGFEEGAIRFWLTSASALELIVAVASRVQPEALDRSQIDALAPRIAPEFDVGQVASFELDHIGRTDTQFLFLRAVDAPYSLRLEMKPAAAARLVTELREVVAGMSDSEREAQVEFIDAKIEVGKKREESTVAAVPPAPAPVMHAAAPPTLAPAQDLRSRVQGLLSRAAHRLLDRLGG